MKKFIPAIFFIAAFASCKNDSKDTGRDIQLLTDSTVFTNNNVYSDTTAIVKNEVAPAPAKASVTTNYTKSKKVVRQAAPSRNVAVAPAPVVTPPAATPPIVNNTPSPETSTAGNGTAEAGKGNDQSKDATASVPEVQKKKGWSKAAQGAVIGGVGGAVAGAIISKKKGLGAVVGAVVGAAGGYIIGKNKDKKDQPTSQYSDYKIQ